MSEGTQTTLAHITVNGSEKSNKIVLRPACGNWPKETLEEFISRPPPGSADVIYLGEAVPQQAFGQPKLATGWRWQNRSPGVVSRLRFPRWRWCRHHLKNPGRTGNACVDEYEFDSQLSGVVNMCAERKLPFVAVALNC